MCLQYSYLYISIIYINIIILIVSYPWFNFILFLSFYLSFWGFLRASAALACGLWPSFWPAFIFTPIWGIILTLLCLLQAVAVIFQNSDGRAINLSIYLPCAFHRLLLRYFSTVMDRLRPCYHFGGLFCQSICSFWVALCSNIMCFVSAMLPAALMLYLSMFSSCVVDLWTF